MDHYHLSLEMFLSSIYKQELLSRQNNQEFLDICKALDCKSSNFPSSILVPLLVAPLDVKQTLSNLSIYYLSTFKIPKGVALEIESLQNQFCEGKLGIQVSSY